MKTAKFPSELEETKLIDTDGYVLVSDGEGKAKKMRPSVTHTEEPQPDGTVYHYTRLLTEEGNAILESDKDTKNDRTTYDGVYLSTPDGKEVVSAQRDLDADTGNLTHDEVYLRTADGNEVVHAQRNCTDEGTLTQDKVSLRTPDGNDVVYAQRNLTDEGNLTHDEVYLRTAEGSDVVKCERTFDANGDETDKQTTLFAKSLKSLKVETDDGTFTAEQLACGSGRLPTTHHTITQDNQVVNIQGETISVLEIDPSVTNTNITVFIENLPTSIDQNVLLGGRLVVINNSTDMGINFISHSVLTGDINMTAVGGRIRTKQFFTMNGKFFD